MDTSGSCLQTWHHSDGLAPDGTIGHLAHLAQEEYLMEAEAHIEPCLVVMRQGSGERC